MDALSRAWQRQRGPARLPPRQLGHAHLRRRLHARAQRPGRHHGTPTGPDGVTPTTGGEQYAQAAREIASLRSVAKPGAPLPPAYAARRAALLYSYDVRWDLDNHKQNKAWDTYGHLLKYHSALKRAGAPVDVITEEGDFSAYKFLVAPAYQLLDAKLAARWKTYVETGGHLILSCRTGQKDRRGFLWEGPWAAPILDLIGAKIKLYDTLPAPNTGHVKAGATEHTWAEALEPRDNTTALATLTDHFYAGGTTAVTRKLGRGSVTYIGTDSQNGTLEAQLVHDVLTRAGATAENFPEGFCVDFRDGFWIATNFTETTVTAPIPSGAKPLVGTRDVPIAGVTVWQE